MKRVILSSLLPVFLAFSFSTPSHAEDERLNKLSPEHRKWLEEEINYIILDLEREVFLSLDTVEERNRFIEAFWEKRDPNPATPVNEFKEEHYRRLDYANKFYGRGTYLPGWKTDQGQMYIILGEPLEIQRFEGKREIRESHLWFYSGDPAKGLPAYFYLLFFKRYNVGPFELYNPMTDGPSALVNGVRQEPMDALQTLEFASPELARASLRLVTTDVPDFETATPSLGSEMLFATIHESPKRAIRADYADAWLHYGDRVSAEYSFNFVPSRSYFAVLQGPDGTPFVNYSVEIDPQHFVMETDEDETKFYTTLDVTVEARNEEGTTVLAADRNDYLELTPGQFRQVQTSPLSYQSNFPLLPGKYNVSVILRNRVSKRYTVAETDLVVPSFSVDRPSFSGVILGYSVDTLEGIAAPGERDLLTFQLGGTQVYPAADRVFSLGETVHVFVQVPGAPGDSRLRLEFLDGDKVLQERETPLSGYKGGAIVEPFSLLGMMGGSYLFRARLLDPADRVLTEQTAPCQVSPLSSIPRPWVRRLSFDTRTPGLVSLARGDQFLASKRLPEAQAEFETAMAPGVPEFPMARWKLASIALQTGEPARALELLTPIESKFPDQYDVVAGLGLGYSLEGDCSKGIGYLERAKTLRPPDTTLLNVLGDCYRALGENEKAAEAFQSSLALNPEQSQVQERLASVQKDDD